MVIERPNLIAACSCTRADPAVYALSVRELLERRAQATPDWTPLIAVWGKTITFAQLLELTTAIGRQLNAWGLGRGDRIGTLMPGGPEAVILMLAIASVATYAPLQLQARRAEIERSIGETRIRAVVAQKDRQSEGRSAAMELGIPIIELEPDFDGPAGGFTLTCQRPLDNAGDQGGFAQADDVLSVLQTSGTTARSKTVPATQRVFLSTVARNIELLDITPVDRTLHVLSMNHVMGLMTILYSMMAGAQVVCAPGFAAAEFFGWVRDFCPTWLSVPPAIHQSILRHAGDHADLLKAHAPRFVRTAAAPMPMPLFHAIEQAWHAPLLDAYGMSECPMISSNGLRPGMRRPGSVGKACGVEIILLDEQGNRFEPEGQRVGQIAVRGPTVMSGYEGDDAANREVFVDGYFRTGDLGYLDKEGFLFVTGRGKELINRGGMKISPREVDEILLAHASVGDALTFSMPDVRLGEEVAAAVVLRPGAIVSELELRQFAARSLSDHKVPQRIVFVEQIPLGLTGKPLRVGLAARLGLDAAGKPAVSRPWVGPRTGTEEMLAAIWTRVLGVTNAISVDASFMAELGGDSLQAVAMFAELNRLLGRELPVAMLLGSATIAELARAIDQEANAAPMLVPIQPRGGRPPLFCLPGRHGHAFGYYYLAARLGEDQPVYGLQLPRVCGMPDTPESMEQLAELFIARIRAVRPRGPYHLLGYSFGGYLAFEMAQQLSRAGEEMALLAMIDARGPGYPRKRLAARIVYQLQMTDPRKWGRKSRKLMGRSKVRHFSHQDFEIDATDEVDVGRQSIEMIHAYKARPYGGAVVLLRAADQPQWIRSCQPDATMGWGRLAKSVVLRTVPGNHASVLSAANASGLGAEIESVLKG